MPKSFKPIVNPLIVVRKEFEDSGMLFNPDTGETCGLNATGLWVMDCLDGSHTVDDIARKMKDAFEGVTENAAAHVQAFVDMLIARGYAGDESNWCDES